MRSTPQDVQDDFINRNHVCNCFDSTLVDHSFNKFQFHPSSNAKTTSYLSNPLALLAPDKSCLPRDTKRWVCVQRPVTPGTSSQTVLVEPHATNLRVLSWTIWKLLKLDNIENIVETVKTPLQIYERCMLCLWIFKYGLPIPTESSNRLSNTWMTLSIT